MSFINVNRFQQAFSTPLDFNKALAELHLKGLTGEDGVLTPHYLTEAALRAELEQHLASEVILLCKKTVKSSVGQFELETLRDRAGSFEPQLVKKNQTK